MFKKETETFSFIQPNIRPIFWFINLYKTHFSRWFQIKFPCPDRPDPFVYALGRGIPVNWPRNPEQGWKKAGVFTDRSNTTRFSQISTDIRYHIKKRKGDLDFFPIKKITTSITDLSTCQSASQMDLPGSGLSITISRVRPKCGTAVSESFFWWQKKTASLQKSVEDLI